MDLRIVGVDRIPIEVPFREVAERNMLRSTPDLSVFEICRVTLHGGAVGIGETRTFSTWRAVSDEAVKRVWNQDALAVMWEGTLGAGLQMALFDAVGKAMGLPIHALLGRKLRDRAAVSWWAIDMPPEDCAHECRLALKNGYRDFKTKGRPWYDVFAQMEAMAQVVPDDFRIAMDFNDTLLGADHAVPVIKKLEADYPNLSLCETPIPQEDVAGGKRIQEAVRLPIAHHYGTPPVAVQLREELCDAFVVENHARGMLDDGAVCAAFDKPFWLQIVGTGITAAYSLHFAAVLSHAALPAVDCHQVYEHSLLANPLAVTDGTTPVPDAPGLGLELDEDAIEHRRLPMPYDKPPAPSRLIQVAWPNGAKVYYSNGKQMMADAQAGHLPPVARGVQTRLIPDDGSAGWRQLHARVLEAPVREGDPEQ